jgi:hypothetical protein
MSGGYATTMMKQRAEPCGWTNIIRRKITTLTGETSASALTGRCARNCKIKKQKFLDTTDVVRDVEKVIMIIKRRTLASYRSASG